MKEEEYNNEIIDRRRKLKIGCGTFIFPPRWIGEILEFPNTITHDDLGKLQPLFDKYREIVYKTKYQDLLILVCRDGFIGICGIEGDYNLDCEHRFLQMLQVITAIGLFLGKTMLIVRTNDVFQFIVHDKNLVQLTTIADPIPHMNTIRYVLSRERIGGQLPFNESLIPKRRLIDIDEIGKIVEIAKNCFETKFLDDLITLLESFTHYYDFEFKQSFISSWSIIETWIDNKWEDLIEDYNDVEQKDNEKRISNIIYDISGDWSISHKSLALFLNNKFDADKFKRINKLRKMRNDFIHPFDRHGKLKIFKEEDKRDGANDCFEFAKEIIIEKLKGEYDKN